MALRPEQGYYNLPRFIGANYGETDEINCIPVFYPNTPEHKQLLGALLNIPALKASWFTSTDEQRAVLAGIWQTAYLATMEKWQDEDTCMDCNSLIDCLENPEFVEALDVLIAQLMLDSTSAIYSALQSAIGSATNTPVGYPPSDGYLSENWAGGTNPTCDYDILYAQCLAIPVETNRMLVDTLEKIEAWSNAGEFAQILANLPVVAVIAEAIGVDAALGVIDKSIEFLSEGYIASYTSEFEIAVACSLFCACQSDCEITAQRIIDVMFERVSIWGTFPVFEGLLDWVEWFNANTEWGSALADIAFYAAWGATQAAGTFFLNNGNAGSEMIIQRAANNPDGDWEFCPDCPPECIEPVFRIVNPDGLAGGSVDVTDNMDGTWTVVGTSAFEGSAHRLLFVEETVGCCWMVDSVSYSATPENLNLQYNCDANPTDIDYGNGAGTGAPTVGLCGTGLLAASTTTAFTVTIVYSAC